MVVVLVVVVVETEVLLETLCPLQTRPSAAEVDAWEVQLRNCSPEKRVVEVEDMEAAAGCLLLESRLLKSEVVEQACQVRLSVVVRPGEAVQWVYLLVRAPWVLST
jgi:hypothetical protein